MSYHNPSKREKEQTNEKKLIYKIVYYDLLGKCVRG